MSKPLLFLVLIYVLATIPCPALAQPSTKIDAELQEALAQANPTDLIGIIIVFQDKPTEAQVNTLRNVHSMEVTYVYSIINGVAGRAPAGEIPKISAYDWVKEIWLDKKVYVASNKTVETSKLIQTLQKDNEELKQTISNLNQEINNLQEQISAQLDYISQLEANLKVYSVATFAVGLVLGLATLILVKRTLKLWGVQGKSVSKEVD